MLLWLLTKQEEDQDEDEWCVNMAASTCLGLFAQAVQDGVVAQVLSFVEQHIKSSDWRCREASVMAFGSIMEGPSTDVLVPLVEQVMKLLIFGFSCVD